MHLLRELFQKLTLVTLKQGDVTLSVSGNIYTFKVNNYTTQIPALQITDTLRVALFALNSVGVSQISNVVSIN